jgi:glycosyltransferase involved in cell wall biosynthesis
MEQRRRVMRVAMMGEFPLDSTKIRGGVQAVIAYLVKGLAQIDGLQVHVLTLRHPNWTGPDTIEQNGVTVHLLPIFPPLERLRNYRTYLANLKAKLAQIRPDVVHAQDSTSHAYVALRCGYPAVVTAHGVRCEDGKYYGSLGRRLRNYFDSWIVERYIMRHVRHLIVTGLYVSNYFKPLFRPDVQIHHIPNAIDESFFDLTDTSDGRTILYAGRVIPRKRTHDVVQAFAQVAPQVPSARLRVVGECTTEVAYVKSVRNLIRQANLQDRIQMTGAISDISREFAGGDFLVLSSAEETSPMVIAQAMAAGKPVIATRVGGVPEMVGEDGTRGFLIDVGDVDGLVLAMLRLLQEPELRTRMGQSAHQFAVENHRLETVAQRTFKVYQNVTAWEKHSYA